MTDDPRPGQPADPTRAVPPIDVDAVVDTVVQVLRSAAALAKIPPDEAERQIAELLAFVRRRLTADYDVDEFGFDEDFTLHAYLPLLRPLYRSWFRVEVRGAEHVPAEGGALVVANHSGTIALDALPELRMLEVGDDRITIGAALSLSEIERGLAGSVPLLDELFPQFASRLIRNGATLGGNLGTASPIGDSPPV